jgi:ribosome assembly protein YihI (activator of Der GTPase)
MEVPDELVAKILDALEGCSVFCEGDEEYNDEEVIDARNQLEALARQKRTPSKTEGVAPGDRGRSGEMPQPRRSGAAVH